MLPLENRAVSSLPQTQQQEGGPVGMPEVQKTGPPVTGYINGKPIYPMGGGCEDLGTESRTLHQGGPQGTLIETQLTTSIRRDCFKPSCSKSIAFGRTIEDAVRMREAFQNGDMDLLAELSK